MQINDYNVINVKIMDIHKDHGKVRSKPSQ